MLAQFFENSLTIIVNIYIIILFITGALSSTDPSVFDQEASLAAQEACSTVSTSGMKKCLVGKIMQNTPPPPPPWKDQVAGGKRNISQRLISSYQKI